MKMSTSAWTYEQYDLTRLNDNDLEKFWRVIQDTWSFFFGEYTKCNCCGNIEDKKSVYEKFTSDFDQYTIEELEHLYNHNFKCSDQWCEWSTERIWWENFISDLEKSLTTNVKANLITFKNKSNELAGLWYSYINTLSKIHEQDLYFDFPIELLQQSGLNNEMDDQFVIPTWLSIIQREKNFNTVMTIGKYMMMTYDEQYDKLPGILASLRWSWTDRSYRRNWAVLTGISSPNNANIHLLKQNNMIADYKKRFSLILEKNPYTPSY